MNKDAAEKILRIGIIHRGKVVEELLLRQRQTVTVGSAAHNTVVVPGEDAPGTLRLFDVGPGGYALCFKDGMQGRLMVGESAVDLADVQNLATRHGDQWRMMLTDQSQGKVQLGEATLLFQFVTPPPVPSRAVLPAVARGGLLRGADPFFSVLVAGSLVFHFGLALVLSTVAPPPAATLEDMPEHILKFLTPNLPRARPPEVKAPLSDEKPVEQKATPQKQTLLKADTKPASVKETLQNRGLLKALVSRGAGSPFGNVFASSGPAQGLGEMLSQAGGVEMSHNNNTPQGPRGGAQGNTAATIEMMGIPHGGGRATEHVGQKQQVQVRAHMDVNDLPEVEGGLDPRVIARILRARTAGFKACYENALKRSPALQGKITVGFTVGHDGRVEETEIEADTMGDAEVARCVAGLVKRTRFPAPARGAVQASFPFVFVNADR